MSYLNESSLWEDVVYQIEKLDKVTGGPAGNANKQAITLANRSRYLRDQTDGIKSGAYVVGSAQKLANPRTITATGAVTGSVVFDGTANVSLNLTQQNSGVAAGTYRSVTVDAAGIVTNGSNPTTLSGYGITDATPSSHIGAGGAVHAQATTSVDGFMSATDKAKLNTIAANANNYVHPTSGAVAGTYRSVTVDVNGHVSGGTNPTTLSGYGITDAAPSSHVGATGSAHGLATTTVDGFMSSADKTKLDTIAAGSNQYIHPDSGVTTGSYTRVVVNAQGHVTAGSNPTTLSGYGITDAMPASYVPAWSTITGKPTTIAGYGITDAQPADPTLTALASVVGAADKLVYFTALDVVTTTTLSAFGRTLIDDADAASARVTLGAQAAITGAATSIVSTDLAPSKVLVSDGSGKVMAHATATATEVGYLAGVTSGIQTQINNKQPMLGFTPENFANKNVANGYAGLDNTGKLNPAQLPALAITDTFVVASQTAQLSLTAEPGDVAIRTDLNKTYILKVAGPSAMGNWQELLTPTDLVSSVNGQTGVVNITTITGNAGTATKLATPRTITLTGGATGSVEFDGSSDVSLTVNVIGSGHSHSVATSGINGFMSAADKAKLDGIAAGATNYTHPVSGVIAGAYRSVTVDINGHVTAGTNPTTLSGYGITDAVPSSRTVAGKPLTANISLVAADVGAQPADATLTAMAAVTTAADQIVYFTGVDAAAATPLTTFARSLLDDATASDALTTLGAMPASYVPSWSVITSTPTTLAGYGITDAAPGSHVGATGAAHGVATSGVAGFMSSADKAKLDTVASNANNYIHPTSGVGAGTYRSVTVDVNGHVTAGTNPANWGTARTITIGSTGKAVDGSANVSWTLAEIGAAPAKTGAGINVTGTNTAPGTDGDFRYNPVTTEFEGFTSAQWQPVGGGSGGVIWEVVNANTVAKLGHGYLISSDNLTITLPTSPLPGRTVGIGDYNGLNHSTVVARNGKRVMGIDEDFVFDIENAIVVFTYIDDIVGWVLTQGFGESNSPGLGSANGVHYDNAQTQLPAETVQEAIDYLVYNQPGRNVLINGGFQHWQRGSSLVVPINSASYMADRYIAWSASSTINAQLTAVTDPQVGQTKALKLSGNGAVSNITLGQRVEAKNVVAFGGGFATFSCWVKLSRTATVKLNLKSADAADNFSATTSVVSLPVNVPAGAWKRITVSAPNNANCLNGILAELAIDALATDNTVETTGWQLEAGGFATPFEYRHYDDELRRCQRYFQFVTLGGRANAGYLYLAIPLPVTMRATPTIAPQTIVTDETVSRNIAYNGSADYMVLNMTNVTPTTQPAYTATHRLESEL